MRLENKIALVTGGGQGIGKEIAKTLALNGAFVLINYIDLGNNQEIAQMTKNEIESLGGKCEILPANVASYDETLEMFKTIKNEYGRLDILINNAGITKDGLLMAMSEADFDNVIDTNLKGCFQMIRFASRRMMKQRYGRIINVSSVSGVAGNAGQANYSASKAGIIGLTKSAAKELASRGITCNAIAPGFILTDMTAALSDEVRAEWAKKIPLRRGGTPEDVANIATFLASDMSSYVSGQVIQVDGGMNM